MSDRREQLEHQFRREARIGVAAIVLALSVFACVAYLRVSGSLDPSTNRAPLANGRETLPDTRLRQSRNSRLIPFTPKHQRLATSKSWNACRRASWTRRRSAKDSMMNRRDLVRRQILSSLRV